MGVGWGGECLCVRGGVATMGVGDVLLLVWGGVGVEGQHGSSSLPVSGLAALWAVRVGGELMLPSADLTAKR